MGNYRQSMDVWTLVVTLKVITNVRLDHLIFPIDIAWKHRVWSESYEFPHHGPFNDIPTNSAGKVIINAQLFAAPGKADALQKCLSDLRKHANSDAEPGCSLYRTVRSYVKDGSIKFSVFEEYADINAVHAHFAGPPYKALVAAAGEGLLAAPPQIEYFYEFQ